MFDLDGVSFFLFQSTTFGTELWKTDGTAAGTSIVKDINPGSNSTSFGNEFRKVGNKLYFTANNNSNGLELWITDGTEFIVKSFGFEGSVAGEVVFNTSMTGYPESLTDPSFAGQIMVATYPLIGNYGVPEAVMVDGLPDYFESDLSLIHI